MLSCHHLLVSPKGVMSSMEPRVNSLISDKFLCDKHILKNAQSGFRAINSSRWEVTSKFVLGLIGKWRGMSGAVLLSEYF